MLTATKNQGPTSEVSVTRLFGKMVAAQRRGDFIRAGEAQEALEHFGWTIRRRRRRVRKTVVAAEPIAAEDIAAFDGEESEGDRDQPMTAGVLGLVDVAWLVGATAEEVEKALEVARFPQPDGNVSGKPYWETATLDRWANRGGRL